MIKIQLSKGDSMQLQPATACQAAIVVAILADSSPRGFSAVPLPPCFMLKIGKVPRALSIGVEKRYALFCRGGVVLLGLSQTDALARAERLSLRGRPDGFHLWN